MVVFGISNIKPSPHSSIIELIQLVISTTQRNSLTIDISEEEGDLDDH